VHVLCAINQPTHSSHAAAPSQVDPELMALILNLSDNQKSELMQRYSGRLASPGSNRRSSEPAVPSPGSSSGGTSSLGRGSPMGRGGLAAMSSGRGSGMMRQQVASKRIDFSVQGRNALTSVNSDSDEEAPLTDRCVFGVSPCFLQVLLVEFYAAQYRLHTLSLLVLLLQLLPVCTQHCNAIDNIS
jgi:hypothetical protein